MSEISGVLISKFGEASQGVVTSGNWETSWETRAEMKRFIAQQELASFISALETQLVEAKVLIERLRELITRVTNEVNLWDNQPLLDDLMKESVL